MKPLAFFIRVMNENKEGFNYSENIKFHLQALCETLGMEFRDGFEYRKTGKITTDILRDIRESDIVFAALASDNPNVWYELGYADSINDDKVVRLAPQGFEVPFDIIGYRIFFTDPVLARAQEQFILGTIREVCENILGVSRVESLILLDSPHQTIPEYLARFPVIRPHAIQRLFELADSILQRSEIRKRAIRVLIELNEIDDKLLISQSMALVSSEVREAVFDAAKDLNRKIDAEFWINGSLEIRSVPVMRSAAISATMHYLNENLDHDLFFEKYLYHSRREVQRHIAATLFSESPIYGDNFTNLMKEICKIRYPEVYNRIREWLSKLEVKHDLEADMPTLNHLHSYYLAENWAVAKTFVDQIVKIKERLTKIRR